MCEDIDNYSFRNLLAMRSALSIVRYINSRGVVKKDIEGDFEYKAIVMPIVKSSSLRGE